MALTKVTGGVVSPTSDYTIRNVTGVAATFTGNVSIGGTLTYEDVTNIDAVGIITARNGIEIGGQGTHKSILFHESNNSPGNGDSVGEIKWASRVDKTVTAQIKTATHNNSNGTDGVLTFWTANDTANADSANHLKERLRIDSSGNVLVGDGSAITPVKHFDVRGTGYQGILVGSTNNQGAQIVIDGIGNGDAGGGNYSALEVPTSGHLTLRNFDADKNIILGTGSQSGANDTVVITDTQKVGIGTEIPDEILHLGQLGTESNNYNEGRLKIGGFPGTGYGLLVGYDNRGSGRGNIVNANNSGGAANRINIGFGAITASGAPTTEVVTINQSGNVGIGTDNPASLLHTNSSSSNGLMISTPLGDHYIWGIQAAGNLMNGSTAGDLGIRGKSGISISGNNGTSTQVRIDANGKLSVSYTHLRAPET